MDEPTGDRRRSSLRAQLRALHPDVGGDPERFAEVLATYRRLYGPAAAEHDQRDFRGDVQFTSRRRGARAVLDACAHPVRTLHRRRHAPPRVR
ncbi:hypothetical protein [Rhodococcus sp. X156]|uniref:hypothetical protein n=1 Tax=Rhodococcus sp. X156 TaxID=2499145 RepID=UPI000FD7038D|nr:hypothetical protein [Rhodococcus sp. X156]